MGHKGHPRMPGSTFPLSLVGALLAIGTLLGLATRSDPVWLAAPPVTLRSGAYRLPLPAACPAAINRGNWTDWPVPAPCARAGPVAACATPLERRWVLGPEARACGAARLGREEALSLLEGARLVFAGDSIVRKLYGALLRLVGDAGQAVVEGHQDFQHSLPGGAHAAFFWRPYPANLSALLQDWPPPGNSSSGSGSSSSSSSSSSSDSSGSAGSNNSGDLNNNSTAARPPNLVLLGASLWHLLHITDAADYAEQLRGLAAASEAFLQQQQQQQQQELQGSGGGGGGGSGAAQGPPLVLLASTPEVYPNRLPSGEKRRAMTPRGVDAHNKAVAELLSAGGPFQPLDLFGLTQGCGEECSIDGVHSLDSLYDAALQLLLGMLRYRRSR